MSSSPVLRQAVSHSAYSAVGTFSVFVVNFLFAGLTIRFLGNEQAGFFIVLSSLFALSQAAGGLGLTIPATKRTAELYAVGDYAAVRRVAGMVLLVNSAIGAVVVLACAAFFSQIFAWSRLPPMLRADAFLATLLMAGAFLADQAGGALRMLYASCQRQDLRNYTLSAVGLGGGLLKIAWLAWYPTMPAAAGAAFAVSVGWFLLDFWLVRRLLGAAVSPAWCMGEIRPMVRFSAWELFSAVGVSLGTTVDRFVLTTYLGAGSLPYYAIAQRFFQLIHTALAQQFSFVFPLLAASKESVQRSIDAIEDRLRWFMATLGALLYAGVFIVGPAIVARLIGQEFADEARWPIYLATVQGLAVSFAIANYLLHYSVGNAAANALYNFGTNVVVVILGLILIPRFDYIGASLAQLAVLPGVIIFLFRSKRILHVNRPWAVYVSAYLSPILLFLIATSVGRWLELQLGSSLWAAGLAWVVGCAAGVGALVACEVMGFPSRQRLKLLQSIWRVVQTRLRGGAVAGRPPTDT